MNILFHIMAGLMLGYAIASCLESYLHRTIHHAGPRIRRLWAHYPMIGRPFRRAYYSHGIVHHRWTFRRDFVTQFCSEEERARLDKKIPGDQGSLIRRERYGLTLRGVGIVWFNLPIVPCVPLIAFVFGPWVLVGALPGLAAYSCLTIFVHPYLHRTHDGLAAGVSPVLRWILDTRYVQYLRQYHYLHHRYLDCNFNLLLGGDVLFGRYRGPTAQDCEEMCRLGLVAEGGRGWIHLSGSA